MDLKQLAEVQITSVKRSPSSSMKVTLSAAKAAVRFYDKLLLPQAIKLFNSDTINMNKTSINEFKIIQQRLNCFCISDITRDGVFRSNCFNVLDH